MTKNWTSPVVQKIFAAGADDLEIMSNFFWTVSRRIKLTDRQTAKILSFWDRCLNVEPCSAKSAGAALGSLESLKFLSRQIG